MVRVCCLQPVDLNVLEVYRHIPWNSFFFFSQGVTLSECAGIGQTSQNSHHVVGGAVADDSSYQCLTV